MPRDRIAWVDALNITACIGVVLLHSTNKEIYSFCGYYTPNFFIGLFTHSFFLWPVNVFFMLSGFTIMKKNLIYPDNKEGLKNFYLHRFSRIFFPVLIWNCIYAIIYGIRFSPIVWPKFLNQFILMEFNGYMWFFIPLIIIYICYPWYNILVTNCSRLLLKWFIIIGLFLVIVSVWVENGFMGGAVQIRNLFPLGANYLIMAASGYYFGNNPLSNRTKNLLYFLGLISAIFIFISSLLLIPKQNYLAPKIILYLNFPCILTAIAVFIFFKYVVSSFLNKISQNLRKVLITWSSYSLGIYLIQAIWFKASIVLFGNQSNNGLILFAVIYTLSLISVAFIKRIPILCKIV